MAFKKPTVKTIEADIGSISIYLRSVKKFGKSTLFRNLILAKYGDPENGLLVEIGHEFGDKLLDNVNSTHIDTYKDFIELKKWLIEEKGHEHHIKIIGFDVVDEMIPIFEGEVIRLNNIENPQKKAKSIKSCFGGYNAGIEMAAKMVKEYITDLKKAGFGIILIAHTKMKQIKEKGSIDEEGYQVLTSNLQNAYESAFGDVSDLVLTGYIDRSIETVGSGDNAKRYATGEVRKLYFRGTSLIDAGSRFAPDAVPEYMVFDKMDMGDEFVRVIEQGIEKSKTLKSSIPTTKPSPETAVVKEQEKVKVESDPLPEEFEEDADIFEEETVEETDAEETRNYPDNLLEVVMDQYKKSKDKLIKGEIRDVVKSYGKFSDLPREELEKAFDLLNMPF